MFKKLQKFSRQNSIIFTFNVTQINAIKKNFEAIRSQRQECEIP